MNSELRILNHEFMFQSCLGIILKKIPYSESDEIITVLLKGDGVRRFFVRGSRKSKKRYPGLIDHFAHLQFSFKESSRGLAQLQDVQSVGGAQQVSLSLKDFAFLSYLAELIVDFIHEGDGDHGLYDLWLELRNEARLGKLSDQLVSKYLAQFFASVGYASVPAQTKQQSLSHRRITELTEFSERLLQKKSRAAAFFLKTLQARS